MPDIPPGEPEDSELLGNFGCGAGSGCTQCRLKERAYSSIGQASTATSTAPVFEVECAGGCPPIAAGDCRTIVRQAIVQAVKLANNAAARIEAATSLAPAARDEEAKETARLYKFFFGHDPTFPVPWAGNQASGISVAKRYRAVARELGGGRRMTFRCLPTTAACGSTDFTCCAAGDYAWVKQDRIPNVIHLCERFWNPPPGLPGLPPLAIRAGTLIHEMLHLLFEDFLLHNPPGRPNAYCYDAFAMRIAGFGANRSDVDQCRTGVAGNPDNWNGIGQLLPFPFTSFDPPAAFDPIKAAREAAQKRIPLEPPTPEERIQRILKQPIPSLPEGISFQEWVDKKLAERGVSKWMRDSIWKSALESNWGLLSNLLRGVGIQGTLKDEMIETARKLIGDKHR
jgi:hypothetical protein